MRRLKLALIFGELKFIINRILTYDKAFKIISIVSQIKLESYILVFKVRSVAGSGVYSECWRRIVNALLFSAETKGSVHK